MSEYQVLARKYRPQSFLEVLGQDAIVTTLKNAIKYNRLAHAYLFCGSRGTGKTTLARVFAKALNCQSPSADFEPCNQCSSCREIAAGCALDVLEIDGASHRGIDDIRQINETVGYASSAGKYKIYIIDEVHMLTKEAFNALLKTLEEPPPKVKFFFATTEPHKVLPTILSRCQRFNLNRIPSEKIVQKLQKITLEQNVKIDEEAIRLLAKHADGGLRDAESLLDHIIAFHEGAITTESVAAILGVMPRECLFALDKAGKEGNFAMAFEIAHQVFSQGRDLARFVEEIIEHFRHLLLVKLSGKDAPFLSFSEIEKEKYEQSSKLYSQEQCMTILDFLIEAQSQIRFQMSGKIALEALLLRVMRTHHRLPVEILVRRLADLEQAVLSQTASPQPPLQPMGTSLPSPPAKKESPPAQQSLPPVKNEAVSPSAPPPSPADKKETIIHSAPPIKKETMSHAGPSLSPAKKETVSHPTPPPTAIVSLPSESISIDPTPSRADLGLREEPMKKPADSATTQTGPLHPQSRYDTILQFAAVELEGTLQKHKR